MEEYTALRPTDFVAKSPRGFALEFGTDDPIKEMISLASINAICQHVMRKTNFAVDSATDSLGLMSVSAGDRIGMVGLFSGLIKPLRKPARNWLLLKKMRS
jgi:hypothetical protein